MSSLDIRKALPSPTDESIFVFERPYFLAFLPWLAIGLALILAGIIFIVLILASFPGLLADPFSNNIFVIITTAYFLLLVPFLTVAFIDFYYDIYIVTDRRLIDIDQHNLFSRHISELTLEEVQDVTSTNNGILKSIFDFGDVTIETSGATPERFEFNNVLHPREIATIILDLSEQSKQRIEDSEESAHLIPAGPTKGVISGEIFTNTAPLREMGAIVGHQPEHHSSATIHGTVGHTQPMTLPPPPMPTPPPQPQPPDLDIVIDDPNRPPQ